MAALAYVDRLRMAICERQGGHHYFPEGMRLFETEMLVEGEIAMVCIAVATEECTCGMSRVLMWPVREDVT